MFDPYHHFEETRMDRPTHDTLPDLPVRIDPGDSVGYLLGDRHVEVTNTELVEGSFLIRANGITTSVEVLPGSSGTYALPDGPGMVENSGEVALLFAFVPW
jgi:hypothetical protein